MMSAVYACMNREDNLIQSIESWIDLPEITEFIIVDWSSSKPLVCNPIISKYMKSKNLKVYRVKDEKYFSLPKAYNLAVLKATNKIILKLDSDYKNINRDWIKHLIITDKKELNNFYIVGDWLFSKSLTGFLLINKKDFVLYNENFDGWGFDDSDLYIRVSKNNKYLKKIIFFNIQDFIYHIPHSEDDRTSNYKIKNKLISLENNKNIANNKFEISKYKTIYEKYNYIELKRI